MIRNLIVVIFGASGDLTLRKLIPALYNLFRQNLLPISFEILGVGRSNLNDENFRKKICSGILEFTEGKTIEKDFLNHLKFLQIDTDKKEDYELLKEKLGKMSLQNLDNSNVLFYFATPPISYANITRKLFENGLTAEKSAWRRIIIEKPFGHDLVSAKALNKELLNYLREEQIYRIDHYLGKETVQNILVTRFSNGIFEPLWNRNYVKYVEITSAESLGVGSRIGYYEKSGALRDMLQNHLLQILALIAIEPPVNADANSIRNEMVKVFQSLRPIKENEVEGFVIRGQYTSSEINGKKINGYREEKAEISESRTDTYVAMKCLIDNWRWSDVPFYIRTGKRLPTRVTEVVIHFKNTPHHIFSGEIDNGNTTHNKLIIRIQPDEGILLKFRMKVPGGGFEVKTVNMNFHYSDLESGHLPEAYERLLCDCIAGDATLYQRGDALEATWQYVQPILNAWAKNEKIAVFGYPAGSWGPEAADELLQKDGFQWRYPCKNLVNDGNYCQL